MSNSSQMQQSRATILIVVSMVIGFAVGLQFGGWRATADPAIEAAKSATTEYDYPAIAGPPELE